MTRDEAKQKLEAGETLYYGSWYWSKDYYSCGGYDDDYGPCCEDSFSSVKESLDHLECMCGGHWEEVS